MQVCACVRVCVFSFWLITDHYYCRDRQIRNCRDVLTPHHWCTFIFLPAWVCQIEYSWYFTVKLLAFLIMYEQVLFEHTLVMYKRDDLFSCFMYCCWASCYTTPSFLSQWVRPYLHITLRRKGRHDHAWTWDLCSVTEFLPHKPWIPAITICVPLPMATGCTVMLQPLENAALSFYCDGRPVKVDSVCSITFIWRTLSYNYKSTGTEDGSLAISAQSSCLMWAQQIVWKSCHSYEVTAEPCTHVLLWLKRTSCCWVPRLWQAAHIPHLHVSHLVSVGFSATAEHD